MFCPSCERLMPDESHYCSRCGMFLTRKSERLVRLMLDFGWIWRRSWAGFASGFFGWIIVFIISRMMQQDMGMMLSSLFSGMICGVFLGTVGGIVEESGYKALCGGLLGTIGGGLGGVLNIPLSGLEGFLPLSVLVIWAVGGAFIGATSGVIERDAKKILAGMAFGLVGGAVGGYLGSAFYGSAMAEFSPQGWFASRLAEGLSGGLLGAVLWFSIGIIEKLYIFHRREDPLINKKICDSCGADNPLQSWYCAACGRVLQTAAPRQKIAVTPYRGIERVTNAARFLSWLFGVTGFVTTPVIFLIFLMQNIYLAFISAFFSALLTYLVVLSFRFAGDLLTCFSRISTLRSDSPVK